MCSLWPSFLGTFVVLLWQSLGGLWMDVLANCYSLFSQLFLDSLDFWMNHWDLSLYLHLHWHFLKYFLLTSVLLSIAWASWFFALVFSCSSVDKMDLILKYSFFFALPILLYNSCLSLSSFSFFLNFLIHWVLKSILVLKSRVNYPQCAIYAVNCELHMLRILPHMAQYVVMISFEVVLQNELKCYRFNENYCSRCSLCNKIVISTTK